MIYIIILGLIAGYREVQILCEKINNEVWNLGNFRKVFWWTKKKWNKNLDSFHFSIGLFALVMGCAIYAQPEFIIFVCNQFWTLIVHIVLAWVVFFYGRNLAMHVILPLKPDFRYLIPLVGTLIKK